MSWLVTEPNRRPSTGLLGQLHGAASQLLAFGLCCSQLLGRSLFGVRHAISESAFAAVTGGGRPEGIREVARIAVFDLTISLRLPRFTTLSSRMILYGLCPQIFAGQAVGHQARAGALDGGVQLALRKWRARSGARGMILRFRR